MERTPPAEGRGCSHVLCSVLHSGPRVFQNPYPYNSPVSFTACILLIGSPRFSEAQNLLKMSKILSGWLEAKANT